MAEQPLLTIIINNDFDDIDNNNDNNYNNNENDYDKLVSLITYNLLHKTIKYIANSIAYNLYQIKFIAKSISQCKHILDTFDNISSNSTHMFDIGNQCNPRYIVYIFIDITNKRLVKIINYNKNILSDFTIIKEITYQLYADKISNNIFHIPTIYNYGKITSIRQELKTNMFIFNCLMFIEMELIQYMTLYEAINYVELTEDLCNAIVFKINNAYDWLVEHDIYHNDFHSKNILINIQSENNIQLTIIDFGNACTEQTSFIDWTYDNDKLKNIKDNYYVKKNISFNICNQIYKLTKNTIEKI